MSDLEQKKVSLKVSDYTVTTALNECDLGKNSESSVGKPPISTLSNPTWSLSHAKTNQLSHFTFHPLPSPLSKP